ncbi:MAG: hypothetical protein KF900_13960 [Bacteroidetes bacterium]|nr:hypothetical protein [Bacteroidota bacterium]
MNFMDKINTKTTWDTIKTIASVVVATLFIQKHITETIKEQLSPLFARVDKLEITVSELKETVLLHDYRINRFDFRYKEALKPSEIKIKEE